MAAITVQLTNICAGGEHLTFTVSGATAGTILSDVTEITAALTDEDRVAFVKALVRLCKIGRNNAQLRTLLQNGVTVSV